MKNSEDVMANFAYEQVSPVLVEYTKWVLLECQKIKINKVYFLARDGFVLREIAQAICKKNNIDIDCRYLYVSRYSLRMPTFNLIGEEAYKMLFIKSYYYTLESILKRAGLDKNEIGQIACELKEQDIHKNLSKSEFQELTSKLKNSDTFNKILEKNSREAYDNIIRYFEEQKLFEEDKIVIVDSGWTGSMQRSLRQIADAYGYKGKITGFYFGLFTKQKEEDGEYLTYYFSANKNKKHKIMFNSNLFECMLSANHGMTMGYKLQEDKMVPVLNDYENKEMLKFINIQIDNIKKYALENIDKLTISDFNLKKSIKFTYKKLKRIMIYPTKEEVKMLSNFTFCDDASEGYFMPLADKNQTKELKAQMLIPRLFKFVFGKKKKNNPIFWPYGVIAFQPKVLRPWYRLNIMIWDFLRFTF